MSTQEVGVLFVLPCVCGLFFENMVRASSYINILSKYLRLLFIMERYICVYIFLRNVAQELLCASFSYLRAVL